jgi:hypothetical protein
MQVLESKIDEMDGKKQNKKKGIEDDGRSI